MFSSRPRTIVVEARKDPVPAAMLDAMAEVCRQRGDRVVRWRGPLSGRLPFSRWLPMCDAAILYNGAHRLYRPALARLRAWGAATLFVELGWHPQKGNYQVDVEGVNSAASWSAEPLRSSSHVPLAVRGEDLLVLLQLDNDTQITERSPWFVGMRDFCRHLVQHSALPLRVRKHPLDRAQQSLVEELAKQGVRIDESPSLETALNGARAVACINSSSGVTALAQRLPVLCYGEAVYRHPGAVYTLTNLGEATHAATLELKQGRCSLNRAKIEELVARICSHQWQVSDVPARLPPLLDAIFATLPHVRPSWNANLLIERSLTWLADWPARILYHRRRRASANSR